jgi:nitroimidazol reductase NimA-like FMN-containing flavoprotein (pyridoxamine 5'-phosphate oxidase superfamily)
MLGQLDKKEIEKVLNENVLGRIGCHDQDRTYVVPVTYVYDGTSILAHSVEGLKIRMMRANPQVCFEVDDVKDFTNWKSVILWGEYEEITDADEKNEVMQQFVDRVMRLKISETALPPETTETRLHPRSPGVIKPVIYKIKIKEMTGRYEQASLK